MPYLDEMTEVWNSVRDSFSTRLPASTIRLWFDSIRL